MVRNHPKEIEEFLTFDDVLLVPAFSEVLPKEVDKVKKSESGMILNPITMEPEQRIYEALEIMKKYRISGVPIIKKGKLVGILTNRDLRFEKRLDEKISVVMTKDRLITVPVGTTLEASKEILQ